MGHHAAHMWHRRSYMSRHFGDDKAKFIAPMALMGMMAAFAGGALIGMLGGKKAAMHGEGGVMPKHMWLARHHHHGFGGPACRMQHEMAAPGAGDETAGERNEGE